MSHSVQYFIDNNVAHPDLIKLINSSECDPETVSHYSVLHEDVDPSVAYEDRKCNQQDPCPVQEKTEIEARIAAFTPQTQNVIEMYAVMADKLGFEKVLACEVNHCQQAYCAVLVSATHGNLLYSGDTIPCNNLRNYAQTAKVLIHESTL